MCHAAGINLSGKVRFMAKFIFVRAAKLTRPDWDCRSEKWQCPVQTESPHDHELVWSHHWD